MAVVISLVITCFTGGLKRILMCTLLQIFRFVFKIDMLQFFPDKGSWKVKYVYKGKLKNVTSMSISIFAWTSFDISSCGTGYIKYIVSICCTGAVKKSLKVLTQSACRPTEREEKRMSMESMQFAIDVTYRRNQQWHLLVFYLSYLLALQCATPVTLLQTRTSPTDVASLAVSTGTCTCKY